MNTALTTPTIRVWFRAASLLAFLASFADMAAGETFDRAVIVGTVVGPDGDPIGGANVRWNRAMGAGVDRELPNSTRTDPAGRFRLPIGFAAGRTLAVPEVFAVADGFSHGAARSDIRLTSGKTERCEIMLRPGRRTAGQIVTPPSELERRPPPKMKGVAKERLFVVHGPGVDALPVNGRLYRTDAEGAFEIDLPEGVYRFELIGSDVRQTWTDIRAGQTGLRLGLEPFVWNAANLSTLYERFAATMDRRYSHFASRPEVDWSALVDRHRAAVLASRDADALAEALRELLVPLRDIHVWIDVDGRKIPTHRSRYVGNVNPAATRAALKDVVAIDDFAVVGTTRDDGFGYFATVRQSRATPDRVDRVIEAIGDRWDAPGFIIDLRRANGGSEPLAAKIAGRFAADEVVYALSLYRDGPGHDDLKPPRPRRLVPSDRAFDGPVVCLIGPGAVSSGEGFVQMLSALPNVTTVGRSTRGASGNPRPHRFGRTGVTVFSSRWIDLMPDGTPIEGRGIEPDVMMSPDASHDTEDPTFLRGVSILRRRVEG